MVTAQSSIIWILIPGINFCVWYKVATKYAPQLPCVVGSKNVISPFLRSDTTITGPESEYLGIGRGGQQSLNTNLGP